VAEVLSIDGSAHVRQVLWDPATLILEVEYQGGRRYAYSGVSYDTWVHLQKAPSKGSFLRREIQPRHPVRRVA
jgi:hypothetical protein